VADTGGSRARRVLGWPARRLLDRRVEWILASIDEQFEQLETRLGESLLGHRLASLQGEGELALSRDTAQFLNWAEGHDGPAARAGLWFNPPVPIKYDEDSVEILLVNERVVEQPYVFGALAGLPTPARILDVGGSESTVALSLASLGHEVHVVDPRGYPITHPGLHVHQARLAELPGDQQFDAAVALSAIEHFGLGAYGEDGVDGREDREALALIHARLSADALLVMTVPCASRSSADEFQRTYSIAELRETLAAWDVIDLSVAWRGDERTWIRGDPDRSGPGGGVALVTARPR
jgi:hypothetical protein